MTRSALADSCTAAKPKTFNGAILLLGDTAQTVSCWAPIKLALQLRFLRSSESIGHHDSEIVDDGYFDRDDAGALGVIAAGCQSAHGALVHPGAGGGFCGLIPGRTTRRRAAQDRLDACGSGGRSRSLAPAGHSGSRMVGR